jgi:hypothetical protein
MLRSFWRGLRRCRRRELGLRKGLRRVRGLLEGGWAAGAVRCRPVLIYLLEARKLTLSLVTESSHRALLPQHPRTTSTRFARRLAHESFSSNQGAFHVRPLYPPFLFFFL